MLHNDGFRQGQAGNANLSQTEASGCVTQLTKQSLPTPEDRGSNPVVGGFHLPVLIGTINLTKIFI